MSRQAARRHQRNKQAASRTKPATRPMSDRAVYMGVIIVGFFVTLLAWLFNADYWRHVTLLYIVLVAFQVNAATWSVYRGLHLPSWKQSLARMPLRFAGYGTREGKPLEAAHGHAPARAAMTVSIIVSAILVAALALVLIPGIVIR